MQKEGKMLINKEQNQVYMLSNRYTMLPFYFQHLIQCYHQCFLE